MNRKVLGVGLLITLPFVFLLVRSLGRDPKKVTSPLIGRAAPSFQLRQVGGSERVSLESLKGKPIVVNFWATWCVPCEAEHPLLTEAARALSQDVTFLGVVYDDQEPNILRFLDSRGSSYPTLFDDGGKTAIAYGVYGVPETFFIDANGKIVDKFEGALTGDVLREKLKKAGVNL